MILGARPSIAERAPSRRAARAVILGIIGGLAGGAGLLGACSHVSNTLLATAAALGLAALILPHCGILALAIAAPLARTLHAQARDIDIIAAVTIVGALIASARPRLTPLGAGRPTLIVPAALFVTAMIRILGVSSAVPLLLGMAAAYVASRHARDGVARPIHLIRAAVLGGIIAVAFAPEAESFAVLEAVTLSLAAIVLGLVSLAWMLTVFVLRIVRGFKAYPGDRVLIGALAATAGFAVLLVRDPFRPELMIPFGILIGATLARADGSAQPPLADVRGVRLPPPRAT